MKKIKISAVSYTNTAPLMYGVHRSEALLSQVDLSLDVPSVCAQKLIDRQVDIGLVPVAALLDIPGYEIVSDYCIGSVGAVHSVFIFSKVPIGQIKTIRMDTQSRTSNHLALVLLKNHWQIEVAIVPKGEADAYVEIGDRTFGKVHTEPFSYDLGAEWMRFTGLPFAYAVWAAHKSIPQDFITVFNAALDMGVQNRRAVLADVPHRSDFDIDHYLTHCIDYVLNLQKREAIQLFHSLIGKL